MIRSNVHGAAVAGVALLTALVERFGPLAWAIAMRGWLVDELEQGSGDSDFNIEPDPAAVPDYGAFNGLVIRASNAGQRAAGGCVERRLHERERQAVKSLRQRYGAPRVAHAVRAPRVVRVPRARRGRSARVATNGRTSGSRRSAASSGGSGGDDPFSSDDDSDPPSRLTVRRTHPLKTETALDGGRVRVREAV